MQGAAAIGKTNVLQGTPADLAAFVFVLLTAAFLAITDARRSADCTDFRDRERGDAEEAEDGKSAEMNLTRSG
jgi:hypothetical protein